MWVNDFHSDTAHMSATEVGAYMLLRMYQWRHGSLPKTEAQLARIACMRLDHWRRAAPALNAAFGDNWHHVGTAEARLKAEKKSLANNRVGYPNGEPKVQANPLKTHNAPRANGVTYTEDRKKREKGSGKDRPADRRPSRNHRASWEAEMCRALQGSAVDVVFAWIDKHPQVASAATVEESRTPGSGWPYIAAAMQRDRLNLEDMH